MALNLKGMVALVTGASSGIGTAVARQLGQAGVDVVCVGRRQDRLDALAEEIGQLGAKALPIAADLTQGDAIEAMVDRAVTWKGRLDILVNNAGISLGGPLDRTPGDALREMVGINLIATAEITRLALPSLRARGGDIVNIGSVATRTLSPGSSIYTATKAAVDAFSECLRKEVVTDRIRVLALHPGFVRTEFISRIPDELKRSQLQAVIDSFEPLTAADVADCILFALAMPRHAAINELVLRPSEQSA